ncbi:MAG: hypothetical protein CFE21_18325 [Bacteroidetes bacterium B1(2017)]|nr:MAG: hypothetical protein CFE21_18325 [Bacteroidetes bacterium B1(2017)]
MKKILILLLLSISSYAQTVHRVVSTSNLQTVIDTATDGDIIIVEVGNYGNVTIIKRLSIFGTGYFLNKTNTPTQGSSYVGSFTLNSGSAGSIISGFVTENIHVNSNNCLIANNKVSSGVYIGQSQVTENVQVRKNYIGNSYSQSITVNSNSLNFSISNNLIFGNSLFMSTNGYGEFKNNTYIVQNAPYDQNQIVFQNGNYPNVIFENNIFCSIKDEDFRSDFLYQSRPNYLKNNIFKDSYTFNSQLDASNLFGITQESTYVGFSSNTNNLPEDARYQLQSSAVAKTAGEGNSECGAFGGEDPYVLSGMPSIPSIYQLSVPIQVPQNGTLNIQLKAKTNN